ncbi:MAG: hypothetical protein ACPLSK_00335 [bacterium]
MDFRLVEYETGKYVDLARHPLKDAASLQDLNNYPYWPSADFWDYSTIKAQCLSNSYFATIGHSRGFFEINDDVGGQNSLFMNPELWRKYIFSPRQKGWTHLS